MTRSSPPISTRRSTATRLPNVPQMQQVWGPAANNIDLVLTGKETPAVGGDHHGHADQEGHRAARRLALQGRGSRAMPARHRSRALPWDSLHQKRPLTLAYPVLEMSDPPAGAGSAGFSQGRVSRSQVMARHPPSGGNGHGVPGNPASRVPAATPASSPAPYLFLLPALITMAVLVVYPAVLYPVSVLHQLQSLPLQSTSPLSASRTTTTS